MRKSILVTLPTDVLWGFREFKRDEVPAPRISFVPSYTVEEVTDYILRNRNIEPVELSVIGNHALLTDGNHRIVAAKRLGLKMLPVQVVVFFGESSYPFYEHTLKRFKPVSRHLELWLKKIFVHTFGETPSAGIDQELLDWLDSSQHYKLN